MIRTYISSAVLGLMLFAFLPHDAAAYFTTNQTASKWSNTVALFSIEYAFGLEDEDIYMPVMAERGLEWKGSDEKVGYTLRANGDEISTGGTSAGIVLSSAPIVDGMYKIAKGKAQKMMLFVLLSVPKGTDETDYSLQVDQLPYLVDTGAKDFEVRQLNPTELQYYVTKEVELNTK